MAGRDGGGAGPGPNCNDKAPLLASWHRRYGERGLEIVGLAYELTGDPTRDRDLVRQFAERHAIAFPLLLAGTSDKRSAATLPDLSAVVAPSPPPSSSAATAAPAGSTPASPAPAPAAITCGWSPSSRE